MGNHQLSQTFDDHDNRPEIDEPLRCNYCDELFDGKQLKPTYYKDRLRKDKYAGLACPECIIELNNEKIKELKQIIKELNSDMAVLEMVNSPSAKYIRKDRNFYKNELKKLTN